MVLLVMLGIVYRRPEEHVFFHQFASLQHVHVLTFQPEHLFFVARTTKLICDSQVRRHIFLKCMLSNHIINVRDETTSSIEGALNSLRDVCIVVSISEVCVCMLTACMSL